MKLLQNQIFRHLKMYWHKTFIQHILTQVASERRRGEIKCLWPLWLDITFFECNWMLKFLSGRYCIFQTGLFFITLIKRWPACVNVVRCIDYQVVNKVLLRRLCSKNKIRTRFEREIQQNDVIILFSLPFITGIPLSLK